MTTSVRTVTTETTGCAVARVFADYNIGSVVVVSPDGGKPIGIVTQSDIMQEVAAGTDLDAIKAESLMSAPLVTTTSTDDIFAAATLMKEESVRRLPVMDEGELLGILTTTDLTDYLPRLRNTIARQRNEIADY